MFIIYNYSGVFVTFYDFTPFKYSKLRIWRKY